MVFLNEICATASWMDSAFALHVAWKTKFQMNNSNAVKSTAADHTYEKRKTVAIVKFIAK